MPEWGDHGSTEYDIGKKGEIPTYKFKELKERLVQVLEELSDHELEEYCKNRGMTITIIFEPQFISELKKSAILAVKNFELRYFGTIRPEENKITISHFMKSVLKFV